jgi:hypothetical protein
MDRGVVNMDIDLVAELIVDLFVDLGFVCEEATEAHMIAEIIEIIEEYT